MTDRLQMLRDWLQLDLNLTIDDLAPASEDASFRKYFRIISGQLTYIVMDAPPEKESCDAFLDVSERLRHCGTNAPEVYAKDLEKGFLLLSDLGTELYLDKLNEDNADQLYGDAITALLKMQFRASVEKLPVYSEKLLMQEMTLFRDWLLDKHLGSPLTGKSLKQMEDLFILLIKSAKSQPQIFVHRDYHSRNLILNRNNPGIIDYQDAVLGPLSYDLVSLLKDCYIKWPQSRVQFWIGDYYQQLVSNYDVQLRIVENKIISEMFVKGHEDGDNIIAYKENLWKLRMDIEEDDPVRQEIAQALRLEGEWNDIWDLKELVEDAGRTDILVGEFNEQDRQLSLQRVGSFHLDPKSSVLVKKVVKTIGAQSVVYAPNDEGEEYTSKHDIKGKVADIMYHGTTSNYLPGLLRLGLVPGKKETNYEGISHPSAVFFTSRFDEAQHHATHTAKKVGGDPVILELKVPDPALLIPDYDVDMGAGDTGCYDYICQTLRDKQSSQSDVDADSFSLSREVGVYGYKGRVPAAAISGYYILMNAQDELGDTMFYADREQYTEATPEEAAIYVQTKEDFGYGSLEEPEYEEEEDDWGTNESILSNLRNLIKEELVK